MRALRKRRVRSSQDGFTLVEVLVALLLTVIAIIGLVALYMTVARASGFSRHETEASTLAQDKMEVLRTLQQPCTGVQPCTTYSGSDDLINEEEGSNGIYTRTYSITPNTTPTPLYWDYTVTVQWMEDTTSKSVTETSRM